MERATTELLELLEIEGTSGHEERVAGFIRARLKAMGVPPDNIVVDDANRRSEIGGSTGNLIVRFESTLKNPPPRRMFCAHLDTVPDCVGAKPVLDGGKIRNAAEGKCLGGDNRTGCAVLLNLARKLIALNGQHAPTTLVFFVQEEIGLVGSHGMDVTKLGSPLPSLCYNFDSDDPALVTHAVTGTERFHIHITGKASHAGGHPEQGISSAAIAALALADLIKAGWHGRIRKGEAVGSANLGTINGGTGSNVVMPQLHILAEARSHNREFRRTIVGYWREAFERAAASVKNDAGEAGSVRFTPGPIYDAFHVDIESPVAQTAAVALRKFGLTPEFETNDGGMDANNVVMHGIPCVTMGCGQRYVHTPREEIVLKDFYDACRVAEWLASQL